VIKLLASIYAEKNCIGSSNIWVININWPCCPMYLFS
jgi:hypothetical protein